MENFSPVSATLGGILIGFGVVALMALTGRIAGISGIVSGALFSAAEERIWRIFFVAGLILAAPIFALFAGRPAFELTASPLLIVIAGLLVGFGTRLGSGCTSGHGVCGVSRLSKRSFAAVGVFMAVGIVAASLLRRVVGG